VWESMALPAQERVWRLTWFGRVIAVGFAAWFAALAIIWIVARGPVWLHLLAVLPAVAMVVPLRIVRSKVVLTADFLLIRNPFDTHRVPLSQVRYVTNLGRGSVHITTADGAEIEVFAVHTPTLAWILDRPSRVNELMEAIEDAALASGAQIPAELLRHAVGASAADAYPVSPPPAAPQPAQLETSQVRTPVTGLAAIGLGGTSAADEGRFPRRAWFPAYRASEVDALIDRIEATLDGTAGPGQAVTAADVRAARFRTTRRGGYDQSAVDEMLDAYAEQLGSPPGR
jgi:DivIVA domain-containing protein